MARLKRYLKFFLFVTISVALVFAFIYARKFYIIAKTEQLSALKAIPSDAMAFICINNGSAFTKFTEQNPKILEFMTLQNSKIIEDLHGLLKQIEEKKSVDLAKVWFSYHYIDKKPVLCFYLEAKPFAIKKIERYYKKHKKDFVFENEKFYLNFDEGIVICSQNKDLVKKSVKTVKGTNLSDDAALMLVSDNKGENAIANLYVNWKYFIDFLNDMPNSNMQMLGNASHFCSWLEYDIVEYNGQYLYSGFASSPKNDAYFSYLLAEKEAKNSDIAKNLPVRTTFFSNFHISNIYEIFDNSFSENFRDWTSDDVSYFRFRDFSGSTADVLCFKLSDFETAKTALDRILYVYGDGKEVFSTDLIFKINAPNLFADPFFDFFPKTLSYYFSRIGDAVYFSTSSVYIRSLRVLFDRNEFLSANFMSNGSDKASNLDIYVKDVSAFYSKLPKLSLKIRFCSGTSSLLFSEMEIE